MLKKLLTAPTQELGKFASFMVFQLRIWPQCLKLLRKNNASRQAAALSYHTIFGIVPLTIIMLLLFQSMHAFDDIGSKIKWFLYEQTNIDKLEYPGDTNEPGQEAERVSVTKKIDDIVGGFYSKLNKGSIAFVSIAIIIWAALGLLNTIERTFNNIWHVLKPRSFVHRIINYWAVLTLGPLLLGLGLYVSTRFTAAILTGQGQTRFLFYTRWILPYLVSVTAFFFLYFIMPNTKVSPRAAIWGAVVATLVWTLAKKAFGVYVTQLIPYSQVYGVMGLIPLAVLWIYITWWIVLFGLQLTFATQNLKTLEATEQAAAQKDENQLMVTDFSIIDIMRFICIAFENNKAPITAEDICAHLNLPPTFGQKILDHLVKKGLLFETAEPAVGFSPATNAENITLDEIAAAANEGAFEQHQVSNENLQSLIAQHRHNLAQYTLKQIITDSAGDV